MPAIQSSLTLERRDDLTLRLIGIGAAFVAAWIAGRNAGRGGMAVEQSAAVNPEELPPPVKAAATAATLIGYPLVYLPLAYVLAQRLERRAEPAAQTIPLSAVGAWLAYRAVKQFVDRERPPASQSDSGHDRSYPSGHATAAAAIALSAAYLWLKQDDASKALVTATAVGAPIVIGGSRVLLGKHWPTDVIGGLATGTAVAAHVVANG